jgi:Predicted membrane protein (DUF2306)
MTTSLSIAEDHTSLRGRARSGLLWLLTIAAIAYGVWALTVAAQAALAVLGLAAAIQDRSIPPVFALHAATGGVTLAAGAIQFRLINTTIPVRARVHRFIGRTYLYAAWSTSLAGLAVTTGFGVGAGAKTAFTLEAALWFGATTLAFRCARRRDFTHHREWMIRSYALALFFVMFSFIQPTFDASGLSLTATYTVSILSSTAVNLVAAELIIRRGRRSLRSARQTVR